LQVLTGRMMQIQVAQQIAKSPFLVPCAGGLPRRRLAGSVATTRIAGRGR
jgi:hypothetical protein